MIKSVVGDALSVDANILAHQTNCAGVMGAGVAKQIKEKLLSEQNFKAYKEVCNRFGSGLLGNVQFLRVGEERFIANVFGEDRPTGKGLDTKYDALRKGLEHVHDVAQSNRQTVVIPGLMGCGLAGGDWGYVLRDIIEPIFKDSNVQLTIAYYSEQDYEKWCCLLGEEPEV